MTATDSPDLTSNKRSDKIDSSHYSKNYYSFFTDAEANQKDILSVLDASSIRNMNILEIGCGAGKNIKFFEESNKYTGFDYSRDGIILCREKNLLNTFVANAEKIPIKSRWADLVLIMDVVEHLDNYESGVNMVKEVNRVTKNGGLIIVETPIRNQTPLSIRKIFNFLWGLEPPYFWKGHTNEMSFKEIINLFKDFKIRKSKITNESHLPGLNKLLNYYFGGGIIFCAKK